MNNCPVWLRREIKDGLKALLVLRLKNSPAADTIEFAADIWQQAFSGRLGIVVEKIDAPRVREGFRRIFPTVTEWPAPAQVLGLMPPRPPRKSLPAPQPKAESVQEVRTMVEELLKEMNIRDMLKKKESQGAKK